MEKKNIIVDYIRVDRSHFYLAQSISDLIADAAKDKDSGLAHRSVADIQTKMEEGKAVVALVGESVAGFCYLAEWEEGRFVSHSGLIVNPQFRGLGIAKKIKAECFKLTRDKFPNAKIFGLTTSGAVMDINNSLGYKAVPYNKLTGDNAFWKGCESCANFGLLTKFDRKICLCTGMLYNPDEDQLKKK